MKREHLIQIVGSAIAIILLAVLVGCSMASGNNLQPTATPGTDLGSGVVQLLQQDAVLRLTQQAIDSQRIETGAKMTATQQVVDATSTAVRYAEDSKQTQEASAATKTVWNVTVAAGKAQDTATAQANFAASTATSAAQATATQATVLGQTATIVARETSTAEYKTQQAPIVAAQQTEVKARAISADLAAEREKMTNGVIAWGPWVGFAVALAAAIYFARQYLRVRAFKPDERGDAPYLVIDGAKVLDLDALPGALLDLKTQTAPLLTSPENTAQIKARDQFIDLNTRGLPNQFQERKPTNQMMMTGGGPRVELAPYVEVQKLLGSAEQQLSNEEIQ